MNRIYKTLWSAATQSWQAVPETAKASGKKSSTTAAGVVASVALSFTLSGGANAQSPPAINQLPTGGAVVRGTATINQTATAQAAAMTVNQSSQRAVVNWETFNIGSKASVNFVQPNAQAVTLNRVNDSNPSQIFGRMTANGQVFLTNASGVYFSPTSTVDIGALTATTHSISNDNFMSGKYVFERKGATGKVINEGNISAALGGYVALLAPEVQNAGVVVARAGTVAMAAGEMITLNLDSNSGLAGITTTPSTIASLVENKLAVQAPDGQIILSAVALNKLQAGVIKNSGSLEANSLVNKGGKIYLEGDDITLERNSKIEAKGPKGGGTVLVGGDWQGSGDMRQATKVTMEAGATIDASATDNGNGGKVVLWSDIHNADGATRVHGSIKAEAGPDSGSGGQIETSGHLLNVDNIQVSTKSKNGISGQWLLDPYNVTISSSNTANQTLSGGVYSPSADSSIIKSTDLETALANGNVEVTTTGAGTQAGNITVASNISWTTANTLKLTATGAISNTTGNGNIAIGTGGSLIFNSLRSGTNPYSGNISGDGSFIKSGVGGVINLTGVNTYTGTTTISDGSWLAIGNNNATGTLGSGEVIINSANSVLVFMRTDGLTVSNKISGIGQVLVAVSGTYTFTGDNTYSGRTSIATGTLQVGNGGTSGTLGSSPVDISNGAALKINRSDTLVMNNNITSSGTIEQKGTGTTILTGSSSATNTTTVSAGTLQLGNGGTTGTFGGVGGLINNSLVKFNRSNSFRFSKNISGTGAVEQIGTGTTILTGVNTYIGTTTISAGTLQVGDVGVTTATLGSGLVYDNALLWVYNPNAFSLSSMVPASGAITGTGNIKIESASGALTIDRDITLSGASSRIDLLANSGAAAGASAVSDLTLRNTVTTSSTGTIVVLAGSPTTTGTSDLLPKLVGATGALKYKTYNANLGSLSGARTGTLNFYYRQANSLSFTGATFSKVYDRTTAITGAIITGGSVSGAIDGDSFSGSITSGTYASANVGSNITVTATPLIVATTGTGWSLAGFTTSPTSYLGSITPKSLTVTGSSVAANKIYDGTNAAVVTGGTLSGVIVGDTVTLSQSGIFAQTGVGTGIAVTATDSLSGASANNYTLTQPFVASANITAKALTVTGSSVAANKVYDGTNAATVTGGSLSGVISGDTVTLSQSGTFAQSTVGTGIAVTATNSLSGASAGNYSLTQPVVASANITAKALGLFIPGASRVYDGTTSISPSGPVTLIGIVGVDQVNLGAGNVTGYVDKNVGSNKTVTYTGLTLSGGAASNYTLPTNPTSNASITPATLSISGMTVADKTYDGGTSATVSTANIVKSGLIAGDVLTISATGSFADKNVGTGKTVNLVSSYSGADAGNYTITDQLTTTATIEKAPLTVTANDAVKNFGAANPALTVALTGFVGGESASTAGITGTGSATTTATATTEAGAAVITSGVGTLAATNYAFTRFVDGTLTIRPIAILNNDEVTTLIGAQLANLTGAQVASFSANQLQVFSPQQLSSLSPSQLAGITSAQLLSLSPVQIAAISPAKISLLSAAELSAFSDAQLQALSVAQIAAIAPDHFAAFSPEQIMALSISQVINLTPEQLKSFSPAQVASLSAAELAYFDARQLAAIGIFPKAETTVAATPTEVLPTAPVPPAVVIPVATAPVETPASSVIATPEIQEVAVTSPVIATVEAPTSTADTKDNRNQFEAAIPVMTDVAASNAPPVVAAPASVVSVTAIQPSIASSPSAPQSLQFAPVATNSAQAGVLAITILNGAEIKPTTTGVAFEQDANGVTLRTVSAPQMPPVSDKLVFNDKLTTFMVASSSGEMVEFQGSLINKRLVIVAPTSAAKQVARNEMNMVLAAAITSLGTENRVMLANLEGVVLDLR